MESTSHRYAILVVLFNKKLNDSETLNTLSRHKVKNAYIRCVNNGPLPIDACGEVYNDLLFNNDIEIINSLENKPLSWVYNDFLNLSGFDQYVILDDDTSLNSEYIKYFSSGLLLDFDLAIPRIYSADSNDLAYPIIADNTYPINGIYNVPNNRHVHSIGSGLVINKTLVSKFKQNRLDLFDNRYALYGVDISLFRRIAILKSEGFSLDISIFSYLIHSMSSSEKEISEWRYKERLIDRVLSAKHYSKSSLHSCLKLLLILFGEVGHLNLNNILLSCRVFSNGNHPRCGK